MARTLEQILANEKEEVVQAAKEQAAEMLLQIHLAEIRTKVNMTQNDLAEALGVTQPTISEMEKPGHNLTLSSIKRYIEASGSKLRLDVELPDGTHYGFGI